MSRTAPASGHALPDAILLAVENGASRRALALLVWRHARGRLMEQARIVLPLGLYLACFQYFLLRQPVQELVQVSLGLLAVVAGLTLFLDGLRSSITPLGEHAGRLLPARMRLLPVLLVALLLGVGVTFAEPAIAALQAAGRMVDVDQAPYLVLLLTDWAPWLVLAIGAGVGAATVLGSLRLMFGWRLKPVVFAALLPTLALTLVSLTIPEMRQLISLAWDSGAVTTGPVTVPVVLAIGIGMARASGGGDNPFSGFGVVTLASLFPIMAVLTLGLIAIQMVPADSIQSAVNGVAAAPSVFDQSPWAELAEALRALAPLALFLFFVLLVLLRERLPSLTGTVAGLSLCLVGMALFNLGLNFGLAELGSQTGALLPSAFTSIADVDGSPLYPAAIGIGLVVLFAWLLGLGATMAEPALNTLGETVERLTEGALSRYLLMSAVALGVALGIATGMIQFILGWPMYTLLLPAYGIAMLLTLAAREDYASIAWDSAGVTTGPITVPLVMAMGLGVGGATGAVQGFGVLALASVGPIISVLLLSLWARHQQARRRAVG